VVLSVWDRRQFVLGAFAAFAAFGCQRRPSVSPARIDAIHRDCASRIRNGHAITLRPNLVGRVAPRKPAGTPVVIYGADWCEACDIAKAYLEHRGIPYVEHDVEDDASARATMDATLAAAGLPPELSLPVIDVRGTIMNAFMPCVVDAAWDET
jgi:glutaredoxin